VCQRIVTYLPPANVPAQHTRRTKCFRRRKTAMRPFATLLWTFVVVVVKPIIVLELPGDEGFSPTAIVDPM